MRDRFDGRDRAERDRFDGANSPDDIDQDDHVDQAGRVLTPGSAADDADVVGGSGAAGDAAGGSAPSDTVPADLDAVAGGGVDDVAAVEDGIAGPDGGGDERRGPQNGPGAEGGHGGDLSGRPELPEEAVTSLLDPEVRAELRSLPKNLSEVVGRHLVAAGLLVDSDPELALRHARYARTRAARLGLVREAVGLTAYHAGEWAEALSELRAARRMSNGPGHIAVMADCERALGRPERALDLAREGQALKLSAAESIELRIVSAGARRDMGQLDAAVVALQIPELDPRRRDPWSARLFYAYADNLAAAGREEEAIRWFLNAAEADDDGETDAAERAVELSEGDAAGSSGGGSVEPDGGDAPAIAEPDAESDMDIESDTDTVETDTAEVDSAATDATEAGVEEDDAVGRIDAVGSESESIGEVGAEPDADAGHATGVAEGVGASAARDER